MAGAASLAGMDTCRTPRNGNYVVSCCVSQAGSSLQGAISGGPGSQEKEALEGLYLPHILVSSGAKSPTEGRVPGEEASRATLLGQTFPVFSLPDVVWG